ncbi:glycosyltransferase family 4 protein [Salisaeta longa]|uniref:glycosyltransferase family 4 protein n=1 Tax=Salisaeta longa TaxID=503170 RepID=UPI0003B6558B|nr:glycosyltransferase family 4 protein [Salisaeta longa]
MHIAHFAPDLWAPGGIATYVRRLAHAQRARGHTVHFFCHQAPPDAPDGTRTFASDQAVVQAARDLGVDVLHLHKPLALRPPANLPVVRTMHGNQGNCPAGSRYLSRTGRPCNRTPSVAGCVWGHFVDRCEQRTAVASHWTNWLHERSQAAHIRTLPVSHFLKERMVQAGLPAEQLHVVPSPAPAPRSAFVPVPTDGPPRVLFLGRLSPQKGVDWLTKACNDVPDVHLDIAGTGAAMDDLQALAQQLGCTDRVTFHGWCAPERLAVLFQRARMVAVPSVWHEPAGLVTLEAAAAGRPVVASAVGGIPEYADPDFSLLVPPRDRAGLARTIALLAHNAPRANEMGRAGLRHAATTFSMDAFVTAVHRQYDAVHPLTLHPTAP